MKGVTDSSPFSSPRESLWKNILGELCKFKTNGLVRALFNPADNALPNIAGFLLLKVHLTIGIRGKKAKGLPLKLINATYTKYGEKQGSSVFALRLLPWNVTGFCGDPQMITSLENRERPLKGKRFRA